MSISTRVRATGPVPSSVVALVSLRGGEMSWSSSLASRLKGVGTPPPFPRKHLRIVGERPVCAPPPCIPLNDGDESDDPDEERLRRVGTAMRSLRFPDPPPPPQELVCGRLLRWGDLGETFSAVSSSRQARQSGSILRGSVKTGYNIRDLVVTRNCNLIFVVAVFGAGLWSLPYYAAQIYQIGNILVYI